MHIDFEGGLIKYISEHRPEIEISHCITHLYRSWRVKAGLLKDLLPHFDQKSSPLHGFFLLMRGTAYLPMDNAFVYEVIQEYVTSIQKLFDEEEKSELSIKFREFVSYLK